jgi:hypothetical protein
MSALGIGIPLFWIWCRDRLADRHRTAALAGFAVPAAALAIAFLAVNAVQTGSALQPAYQYLYDYAEANQYRFSDWYEGHGGTVRNLSLSSPAQSLAVMGAGVVRLNVALFGWPTSLLLLPLSAAAASSRVAWAALGCFLVLHLPLTDVGIDSFGPVHYTELAWPIVLLTTIGTKVGWVWLRRKTSGDHRWCAAVPGSLVAASMAVAWLVYVPVRAGNLAAIADDVLTPFRAVDDADLGRAVIFSPRPFTPRCSPDGPVPQHFLFWRPNNDPRLQDDILWVNHLDVRTDRRLMERFPRRRGWLLRYVMCQPVLEPIDEADPDTVPPGWIRNRMTPQGLVQQYYDPKMGGAADGEGR